MLGKKALPSENTRLLATTTFDPKYEGSLNQINSYTCSYNPHNVPHIHAYITPIIYYIGQIKYHMSIPI